MRCRCGAEFVPRRVGHRLCDRCYWRRRDLRRIHPRMVFVEYWWLVALMVGAVVLAIDLAGR
jgi:hypothetical protein